MKKYIITLIAILTGTLMAVAQTGNNGRQNKFNPARYQADLERYITKEAALTPEEASKFFPIYREMMKKQRSFFDQAGRSWHIKPNDEAGCRKAVIQHDELDIQIKEIQAQYHKKMMKVVQPSKVYEALKAEDRFHRQSFKKVSERKGR